MGVPERLALGTPIWHTTSMPKRSSKKEGREGGNEIAFGVAQEATSEPVEPEPDTRNPHAVALGRLGGLKGGKARAQKLTKKQRSEIARKAAQARWSK